MGGLNYVVTILQARTRGMTLMRMPLTVWGIFVATVLALFAFPALFVSAIMMSLDVLLGTSFLYACHHDDGQRGRSRRRQSAVVPALCSGSLVTPRCISLRSQPLGSCLT